MQQPTRTTRPGAEPQPKRLTREYSAVDLTAMPDALAVIMANIEDGLIQSGATPGVDYTLRDLAAWAMPFLLTTWEGGKLQITIPTAAELRG